MPFIVRFESFHFRHSLLILKDLECRIKFSLQSKPQLGRCLERPIVNDKYPLSVAINADQALLKRGLPCPALP